MDANELNKKIAAELGMKPRVMQEREYHNLSEGGFAVVGWLQVFEADELMFEYMPNWATDLNAAMLLLDGVDDDYTPRLVRMILPLKGEILHGWKCVIMPNVGESDQFEAIDDTPALAIIRAWLAYRERISP